MPKFHFRGGGGGYSATEKVTKYQEMPKFQWGGGILQLKSQSAKISDNFHFRGGGVFCIAE